MDSMSGPWLGQGVRFFVLFGFGCFFLVRFRLLAGVACRWHAQWWINFYFACLVLFLCHVFEMSMRTTAF